jgi:hypothetical protein
MDSIDFTGSWLRHTAATYDTCVRLCWHCNGENYGIILLCGLLIVYCAGALNACCWPVVCPHQILMTPSFCNDDVTDDVRWDGGLCYLHTIRCGGDCVHLTNPTSVCMRYIAYASTIDCCWWVLGLMKRI